MLNKTTIDALFEQYGSNIPQLAQSCADKIPTCFPATAGVHIRIILNDLEYLSDGFEPSREKISHAIRVPKKCRGKIEMHFCKDFVDGSDDALMQSARETAAWTAQRFEEAIRSIPAAGMALDSEKRCRLLAENSIDAIWIMDPLLNFTYISPAVERMTNYTPEEWVGTNLSQHATRKEFLKMAIQAVRAMRGLFSTDYIIFTANMLRKDGSEIPVEIIGRLLFNKKGLPIGLQGSTRDISRRKETETTLEETQKKYIRSVEHLYQAGQRLGQSLDLHTIYASLHDAVAEIMPCDGLIISSYNETRNMLVCEAMFHEGSPLDVSGFPPIPLEPEGQGTQSQVVHSGQALYLADYAAHQRTSQTSYFINEEGVYTPEKIPVDEDITRSAILVPLKREGRVIGVIQVTSYRKDAFTQENLHFLEALAPQVSAAISNAFLFEETQRARRDLLVTLQETVEVLARTVEMRDPYTAGHQRRVADLAVAIAEQLALDQEQVDAIHMAGIIHDIGKINIPAEILSKPIALSPLEFELIKTHPRVAADLLEGITFPWPIAEIIHQHHEKLDGSGYPRGLSGGAISFEARILIVADIVEAMSSHRPYRKALGIEAALAQIQMERGTRLDAEVVDACLALFAHGYQFPAAAQA